MSADDHKSNEKSRFVRFFQNAYTPWVVLFVGFLMTGAAWYSSNNFVKANAEQRFEVRVDEVASAIRSRMVEYEQVLWGGVGLFRASDVVDRKEFKLYVDALHIQENWPGIQGIGYSIPVKAEDKADHINEIRTEGFPDYTIKPEGDREMYSAIIYLEPFDWRNKRAFGYDMWSNDMRREAMTRARDTGKASTSGIITLVQETDTDVQRGFLTYLPLYDPTMPSTTQEERRAAFKGWVYSPFRMGDLMKGVLGEGETNVEYEIFDGQELNKETLLYNSNETFEGNNFDQLGGFSRTRTLELQGRLWTINFTSGDGYLNEAERVQPTMVAIVGLVVDLLIFFIISSLVFMQRRAEAIALEMTEEASKAREQLEVKLLELKRSNDDLQRFAYIASHDLKSPMRAVQQLVAWIQEDLAGIEGVEGTDVNEHLEQLNGRAQRMQGLLDSLLKYATIGEGDDEVTSFETMASIKGVIEFISPPDNVVINIHGKMPRIVGEKALFEQVIANLIGNAIKHNDSDQIQIDISVKSLGVLYEFSITDNGPGIEKQFQERVLELFKTLKRRDEIEGSGMGLSIVKKVVERRGGTLRIISDPAHKRGTTFVFTWKSNVEM